VDVGGRVGLETEIARLDVQTAMYGGRKRREAERARIDSKQQVVHHRVSDNCDLENVGRGEVVIPGHGPEEMVQAIDDDSTHLVHAVRVVHHIADPCDHIVAERDLRVHERFGADDPAGAETAQVSGHGGRAHVDGKAVSLLNLSRKDGEDLLFHPDSRRNGPFPLSEDAGKGEEGGIVHFQPM